MLSGTVFQCDHRLASGKRNMGRGILPHLHGLCFTCRRSEVVVLRRTQPEPTRRHEKARESLPRREPSSHQWGLPAESKPFSSGCHWQENMQSWCLCSAFKSLQLHQCAEWLPPEKRGFRVSPHSYQLTLALCKSVDPVQNHKRASASSSSGRGGTTAALSRAAPKMSSNFSSNLCSWLSGRGEVHGAGETCWNLTKTASSSVVSMSSSLVKGINELAKNKAR